LITKEWQERFRLLSSDQYTIVLEQVVERYEPPQTLTALQNCVRQAKRDHAIANVENLSEQKTAQLGTLMGLAPSKEKPRADSYPIYYRLCERHVSDVSSKLRAHFHTVLRHCEQRSATRFSIDIQYEDILAIDFCLREVSRSLIPSDETAVLEVLHGRAVLAGEVWHVAGVHGEEHPGVAMAHLPRNPLRALADGDSPTASHSVAAV